MIKFSIVTVTYNAAKVLPDTLTSIHTQTYGDLEHIIIDGASTDETFQLAAQYAQTCREDDEGHEVILVSEPDRGLYDAMNKGLDRATGDYVLFLNAGDTLPATDTLETVASYVADGEELPAVLYGDTDIVNAEGHFLRHRRLTPPDNLSWRSFKWGMLVCHQAFYARTDLAKVTPYDLNYRFSADVDWCIRIMKKAAKKKLALRRVDTVVANFLYGGTTDKNHKASLMERFSVMRHHYGLLTTFLMHAWFMVRSKLLK